MKFRNRLFFGMSLVIFGTFPAAGQAEKTITQPAPEKVLHLDNLVTEALRANPEIRAAELHVEALQARVPQEKALPDPTVTVGWMGNPAPFVVNATAAMSYRGVSAMETFPFPGKLKLRGEIADRESRAAWWDYEAARRSVVSEVKVAYYQYAYFHKALEIVENNQILLESLIKIAEARYEAGQGLQQDILKGQVELSQLLERATILNEQEYMAAARINTLLNRDPEMPLAPPSPLTQTKLTYTLDNLYRLARTNDTNLQGDRRMIERDEDAVAFARKSYEPDFDVSYMYQRMPGGPNLYGAFLGVNIPVFYKSKQRQEVVEASRDLASERSVRENRETTVNFLVKEQFLEADQAQKLSVLYSQAIMPQSAQALESSEIAYEAGKTDFLTMLDNFVSLLEFRVNYYREISDYQISLARLEPLVGVELTK
ncbi:MAG TPA: TolC family protein [Candidatus Dormibacteraeota bacterium]|nr:TolC family protein [Candidatus Dormibacteraeota bacterium]